MTREPGRAPPRHAHGDLTFLAPHAKKVCLVKAMVLPVVMYGCESWTVKKAERRRIDAFNCGVGEDFCFCFRYMMLQLHFPKILDSLKCFMDGGVSGVSSHCGAHRGFSPEARRGSQGASRATPGKSGLHARGEGERVMALESW